jgi:hypothetical protein
MHSRLLLCVWVLYQAQLGIGLEARDFRELDEVIDALAVEFEVEARVLERLRCLYDGLSEILDLLLG